jgi:hypothetical protein
MLPFAHLVFVAAAATQAVLGVPAGETSSDLIAGTNVAPCKPLMSERQLSTSEAADLRTLQMSVFDRLRPLKIEMASGIKSGVVILWVRDPEAVWKSLRDFRATRRVCVVKATYFPRPV